MDGKFRVLLADSNEEYRELMKTVIESTGEFTLIGHTGCGKEALEKAVELRPDVVVTDVVLSGLDGFSLLEELNGLVPGLVMVTGFCHREVLLEVIRRGIRLFLPKPFQNEALLEMLRRACGTGMEQSAPVCREVQVSRALREVGAPPHMKGYPYVRRGILMVMERPELAHALTKALYPALARQFSTTPACVERAIRSIVDAAWLRGDPEVHQAYFGADKPSNGTFIALMAEKLRDGPDDSVA